MSEPNQPGLVRAIGRWSLAALLINSIIGSGVFKLPAEVAGLIIFASSACMSSPPPSSSSGSAAWHKLSWSGKKLSRGREDLRLPTFVAN